jgi:replicative DNA helicase
MGKSSLALRIAENVAQSGRAVLLYSLEMVREQVAANCIVGTARIDSHRARTMRLNADEASRLVDAAGVISQTSLWIDDCPDVTITELRARTRRFALAQPLSLVVVDYLQLVSGGRQRWDSRQLEVSAVGRGLKQLAVELRLPVLALAQLNRQVEARADHRPVLSDLRESGSLEQDADCVMLLYRPGYYAGSQEPESKALVSLAKNRNGKVAEVELVFIGQYMRFESLSGVAEP